jgi:hypothetical protein
MLKQEKYLHFKQIANQSGRFSKIEMPLAFTEIANS